MTEHCPVRLLTRLWQRVYWGLLLTVNTLVLPGRATGQYFFNKLSTAQGLSESTVKVIMQDSRGFLWFGTADGLNCYDGYEFTRFRHQPRLPGSVCGNDIMAIHEDLTGRIWVGTRSNGLCYMDPQTGQFRRIRLTQTGEDLSQTDVPAITHTADGTLWVGTNMGLFAVQPGTLHLRRVALPDERVYIPALLTDHRGNLWIGTYLGHVLLMERNHARVRLLPFARQSRYGQHNWITAIHEDTRHTIRVSTWGMGLFRWEPTTSRFASELHIANEFEKRNLIKAITEDRNGTLWLATDDGLLMAPKGRMESVVQVKAAPHTAGGLTTHALQSLCCDSFGNVWIGTWEGGINVHYAEAKRFNHLGQTNGLLTDRITGVAVRGDQVAVATGRGLSTISRTTGAIRHVVEGRDITSLTHRNDQLCATIWNQGADFFRFTKTGLTFTGQQRNTENPYRALILTTDGRILIGNTASELFRIDPATYQLTSIVSQPINAPFGVANVLCETRSGRIFIGSYNQGLWVYDPQTGIVQPVGHRQSIGKEQVLCLFEDTAQRLWVGTNGKGLFRYKPATNDFESFTTENGLPNDVLKSIIEDNHHNLWIGTNEGLCRFTPRTGTWRVYSEKDGLSNNEFMTQAVCKDERGYLYFGGMQGLTYFHPDSIGQSKLRPKVYLTGLRLLNKPVAVTPNQGPLPRSIGTASEVQLNHQQAASITFEFVGLFFQKNAACNYQYRLEGFDKDWNDVGTQRNATYTNLPPGAYTFRVKASNTDGVWAEQDAHIALTVLPPWYLSGWAFGLYAALLLAGLWAYRQFVRQREKLKAELRFKQLEAEQAHELEQLKTNFFTNVSHEFRTPLTLILDPVDQLLTGQLPPDKVQESYQVIQQNGQRLLRLINELLDLSKIDAERYRLHIERADAVAFLQRIVHSFQFQAEQRHVNLVFKADAESCMADFSPDALEKIAFNLIANAIKACRPDDRVEVRVQAIRQNGQPTRLLLAVQDTGVGLSEADQQALFSRFFQASQGNAAARTGTGIGLALTAELVKLHKGQIRFDSQETVGTTVTVELSIDASDFPAEWISRESSASALLPLLPVLSTAEVPASSPKPDQKQILLIEDNDELRTYLHSQLSTNYAVLTAENGQIGWELALKHVPDLIVSDVIMPVQAGVELDGMELCKRLKTDEKTSHIPVVLLTSRSSVESQLQGLHTGADDYQTKPFTFQLLEARIQNLIQSRQRLRERFSRGMLLQPSQIAVNDTDEQFLKKAIAVIEAHLDDSAFDVERLEKALNMSQMQLYRKLTSLTSMSGNVFIRHIRLHRAKQFLEESNLTVAEIAYRVGFNSPSYFTRAYKKEFGVVPSAVAE